jgi:hypothetical protein
VGPLKHHPFPSLEASNSLVDHFHPWFMDFCDSLEGFLSPYNLRHEQVVQW